ncbi:MAG: recombinase RecA [Clostridia bacterium]|nr:recombinase RecA [Clostridia bacterium]
MATKKATKLVAAPVNGTQEEKLTALNEAIKHLEESFGAGAVMRLGDETRQTAVQALPTGILELDQALGVGGFPRGRIVEIYGPESSGKTTVALHTIAETQKNGGLTAFVDAEHALDPVYARSLGVDVDNLYVSQPNSGEEALDIAEALGRSGALDLIVVDSVSALVPRAEIEGLMGESHVGLQARLMSQAMRKLAPTMFKSDTTLLFINQLRQKVGVLYGSPEVTSGGNALKYYASVRVDVRRGDPIKKGDDTIGNRTRMKVSKNKVAPPLQVAVADMYFGSGFDRTASIISVGVETGIISKSGTWLSYDSTRLGQGRDNARQFLLDNPETAEEITAKVYAHIRGDAPEEESPGEPAAEESPAKPKRTRKKTDAEPEPPAEEPEVTITPLEAAAQQE